MTLRQGLSNFRANYKEHLTHDKTDLSKEVKAFFESHDIVHVLFDCDISLYGEGCVKIWTIFGTTLGFRGHLTGYKAANAFKLSQNFTFVHFMKNIFKFLVSIPNIIISAKRMTKPWDWAGFENYLDIPLADIRKEFNIRL